MHENKLLVLRRLGPLDQDAPALSWCFALAARMVAMSDDTVAGDAGSFFFFSGDSAAEVVQARWRLTDPSSLGVLECFALSTVETQEPIILTTPLCRAALVFGLNHTLLWFS